MLEPAFMAGTEQGRTEQDKADMVKVSRNTETRYTDHPTN